MSFGRVALLVVLAPASASALPRFALREGVPCVSCHVNPSGGGMRNRYGRYVFETTRLSAGLPGSPDLRKLAEVDVGEALSFGADSRTAYIDQRVPEAQGIGTIIQMQADLYVAADLWQGLTLYYDYGAYQSFEAMGIFRHGLGLKWLEGYVKAGRFMPTYGLRLENHNTFIRQDIGFGPRDKDVGAEVGLYAGPILLQASVLGGAGEDRQIDDNREKAATGRLEWIGRFGPLRLLAGGSVYRNETGALTDIMGTEVDSRSDNLRFGGHWGVALGRFAYLGEVDRVKVDPFAGNPQGQKTNSYQSYQELDALIIRGLEVNFNYEFREPDLDRESGRLHRLAGGLEFYPVPFVELKVLYRQSLGSGPAVAEQDGVKEFIGMAHLFL